MSWPEGWRIHPIFTPQWTPKNHVMNVIWTFLLKQREWKTRWKSTAISITKRVLPLSDKYTCSLSSRRGTYKKVTLLIIFHGNLFQKYQFLNQIYYKTCTEQNSSCWPCLHRRIFTISFQISFQRLGGLVFLFFFGCLVLTQSPHQCEGSLSITVCKVASSDLKACSTPLLTWRGRIYPSWIKLGHALEI